MPDLIKGLKNVQKAAKKVCFILKDFIYDLSCGVLSSLELCYSQNPNGNLLIIESFPEGMSLTCFWDKDNLDHKQ